MTTFSIESATAIAGPAMIAVSPHGYVSRLLAREERACASERARDAHRFARGSTRASHHSSFSSTFIRFHPSTSGFSHVLSPVSALW